MSADWYKDDPITQVVTMAIKETVHPQHHGAVLLGSVYANLADGWVEIYDYKLIKLNINLDLILSYCENFDRALGFVGF